MNRFIQECVKMEVLYETNREYYTFRKWFFEHFKEVANEENCNAMHNFCVEYWNGWYKDLVQVWGERHYANLDTFVIASVQEELSAYIQN